MNTAPVDLSIILVTYRTREVVRDCLRSLFHAGGLDGVPTAEVILVDNASDDGTAEMVQREFPQVRLIESAENLGFARANNRGIAESRGRLVLLLNPDTLVPRGELAKCIAFLDGCDAKSAAMTCRVESVDGTLQRDCSRRLITPFSECCRALLLDRIAPGSDWLNRETMPRWDRSDARPVECLLGAFMLMRRDALEQIGGLDERFFLMYEEVDWCRRARDAGRTLWFWPGASITHLGGESWKQDPVATFAVTHVSAMQYFEKHHPHAKGIVRLVSRAAMELKIGLLRLSLLRRAGDPLSLRRLEMARAARYALKTGSLVPAARPGSSSSGSDGTGSSAVSVGAAAQ